MKIKRIIPVLLLLVCMSNRVSSQSLTCLSPTLIFTDPAQAGDPVISSTINCDFSGYIRVRTSPSLNGALTQGNSPCLRLETSLTNANSNTNNSMVLFQGSTPTGTICSTCPVSIPNNSLFTLYWPGLTPSLSHSMALCHNVPAANFTYSVYSCYSNVLLNSGVWNNAGAAGCQTVTIPANTAIGSASFVINPAVPPAAIVQNFGSGYITLDPWLMSPGTYTVTYNFNSQAGCTTSATRTLVITNPFVAGNSNFTPPPNLCPYSNCVNLLGAVTGYTSPNGFPFFSGTGVSSNTFCPSASGPGTFPVTYEVGPTAVCGKTVTNNVTVNPLPAASAASTASYTCYNPSTATLSAGGGGTYAWFGPSIISQSGTTGTAVVGPSTGNYSVTVTSAAGCTAQAVTQVVVNTTSVNVSPNPASNVINCANPQATISVSPIAGVTYAWSGPGISGSSTGAAITATAGGNYNVVVTNTVNGCTTNTVTINAAQNTTVTNIPSTAGSVGCAVSAITLSTTASGPYTWLWTAPPGSTLTSANNGQTASANSTSGGNFTITVNNQVNGCSSTSVIALNVNQTQPTVTASNSGVVNCTNTAINLSSTSSGVSFNWIAPSGSSVSNNTLSSTSASGGGTYSLIVTSTANSCTNMATTAVTTQMASPPTPTITNSPTLTCTNNTLVTITSSAASGVSYSWSGGTISGSSTNASVNVTSPAVYSLAVTSTSNGCTSVIPATVNITSSFVTPTLSASSQTAISGCGSNSITTLSVTANPSTSGYTWTAASSSFFSSAIGNPTVSVNTATTYTLNASHPTSGCISSLVYTVTGSVNNPVVSSSAATGTITCSNLTQSTSVTSNPSSGVTYSWSGPGIVGASNTSTVAGNLAGTYNLVVTNTVNGCATNSVSFVITPDNTPLTVTAANNTVNCTNSSATINPVVSPSGSFNYNWSNGPSTSSIIVSPTLTTNYVVTVTNTANGCTGSQTVSITADVNPPSNVNTSASSVTLSCASPNSTLTGSATGATSYSWIAPGNSVISTTTLASVTSPGTYSFIAVGSNGCASGSSAAQVTVVADSNAPTFVVSNSNPSITCNTAAPGVTVTMTSTVPVQSYSWSPSSGIAGSNTLSTVTFTAPGSYTGIITATNGCSSNTTIVVSSATTAPTNVAGTATAQPITCTNSMVTISPVFNPSNDLSYTWSGPGIVGSTSASSIQVNQSGSYSLTVTNTLTGCSSSAPVIISVTGSNTIPTLTVSSSSSVGISCQPNTSTVTLNAQSGSAVTFTWSNGANTSNISTSTPGTYTVTVSDNNNCLASSTIAVQNNTTSPTITASSTGNLPCGNGTTSLSATSSNTNISYAWAGSGIVSGSNTANPEVNLAGTYTVTALDSITGCAATSTVNITQSTVSALAVADATTGPAPLNVNFTNQSVGAATYSWSFGDGNSSVQTNPTNAFTTNGTYTVVLISTNGPCSASDTLIIKVNSVLEIPEVFTPNGDLLNDLFFIKGLESYPNATLEVFNRWGNPVFSGKPYKNDWDGTPNAAGKTGSGKLPTGTYYYLLELGDKDKTIIRSYVQIQY